MKQQIEISVVVPAFNESESLRDLAEEIRAALAGRSWEMIVVDDGSTDATWHVVRELASALPVRGLRFGRNCGKAAALSAGFEAAEGDFVVTLDADLQDDPAEIPALVEMIGSQGMDVVSGWKKDRKDPASKRIPSRFFNFVVRKTTGLRLHDFNCGLKAYRSEAAKRLDLYGEMHRYTPVLASQLGYSVGERAVNHRPRRFGRSKYGPARFFRGYADLLTVLFLHRYSFRPLHFFGGIGTSLFAAGLVISAYLSVLWFLGESIGRRPLLLLGVFLMMIGFQRPFNIVEEAGPKTSP